MQIFHEDPRATRGTAANRRMLSVLRGLAGSDGATLAKALADARAEKAAAEEALAIAKTGTSRDSYGTPAWRMGLANIQPRDLPDNWTTTDAASVSHDGVRRAILGMAGNRDPSRNIGLINRGDANVNDRIAGWIWSRLYSRDGWPDNNLINAITKHPNDDTSGTPTYFTSAIRWWERGGGSGDSPERRIEVMVDPQVLGSCEQADKRRWGSCLGDIAGQAVYWVKWASTERAKAIEEATNRLALADAAVKGAEAAARTIGRDTETATVDTETGEVTLTSCLPGFKLDPATNKCVVEQKSALPWILGGAAVLGAVLFLRRR